MNVGHTPFPHSSSSLLPSSFSLSLHLVYGTVTSPLNPTRGRCSTVHSLAGSRRHPRPPAHFYLLKTRPTGLTKVDHLYFHDNFGKSGPIFIISVVTFRKKNPLKKLELKLPPPLKCDAAYLAKRKRSTIQLYIPARENNMHALCQVTSVSWLHYTAR